MPRLVESPPERSRPWLTNSTTQSTGRLSPSPSVVRSTTAVSLEEYIGSLSQARRQTDRQTDRQLYESFGAARTDDSRNQGVWLRAHAGGTDDQAGMYDVRDPLRATRTPIFGMPPVRQKGTRANVMQGVKGQYGHLVYDIKVYTNPKTQCLEPLEGHAKCTPIFSSKPAMRVGSTGDTQYTGKETKVRGQFGLEVRAGHVRCSGQRARQSRPLSWLKGVWIQLKP